jgi:uncharacterized protein (TIGR00288 family)
MTEATHARLPDAALLIDWENLKYSLINRDRNWRPNISLLRDAAERHGRLVIARAYADWQEHQRDASDLYASGVEPVYVPVRRGPAGEQERVKNSVDVKVAVDCVEFCARFPTIQTYILVSGDQDFIHIINSLRPYGKRTVVIGASWTTSARLAEQVDAMIYYDREVDPRDEFQPGAPIAPAPDLLEPATGDATAETEESADAASEAAVAKLNQAILDLVAEYRSQGRPLLLSQVGLELRTRAPREFNRYGRGRLGGITTALANHGRLQKVDRGLVSWLYLPGEPVPDDPDHGLAAGAYSSPQRYWQIREHFADLDEEDKAAVIQTIAQLEGELSFLSFGRLRDELRARLGSRFGDVDFSRLLNDLQDQAILRRGEEKGWFDNATGATTPFWTLVLNRAHEDVVARLTPVG